jgi:NO-binding membrane sensor protein with MHYT domain
MPGGFTAAPIAHEPWLVVLSLIMAIQGAYVGLSLAVQVGAAAGMRRRLLLAGAAVSLAVAIWAMHFVAMLAAKLPFSVDYLVLPTLLSFLVCVIVVGAGVFAASARPLSRNRLAASATFMGCGIVSMHYLGMSALHASAHLTHAPAFVLASIVIAIAASGLALWLAEGRGGRPPLLLSAAAFGMAIAGMHYTAMAGLAVYPHSAPPSGAPALSTDLLAIVVAVVAFVLSGIFLLTLVPDPARTDVASARAEPSSTPERSESEILAMRASPLDLPVPQLASGRDTAPAAAPGGADVSARRMTDHLPVERDGVVHFVALDDIVAVHANAHYSYVFNGTAKLFCPLAIGDVEARLDSRRFIRVHRSHIVNIDRVIGLRRTGDHNVIELAADNAYTVPVSRGRSNGIKSRLGLTSVRAASQAPSAPTL